MRVNISQKDVWFSAWWKWWTAIICCPHVLSWVKTLKFSKYRKPSPNMEVLKYAIARHTVAIAALYDIIYYLNFWLMSICTVVCNSHVKSNLYQLQLPISENTNIMDIGDRRHCVSKWPRATSTLFITQYYLCKIILKIVCYQLTAFFVG